MGSLRRVHPNFDPFIIRGSGGGGTSITVEPLSVTENGTYTPEEGKAYGPVAVAVRPPLQSKSINHNGTYTPDDGYYGLSSVTVNIIGATFKDWRETV